MTAVLFARTRDDAARAAEQMGLPELSWIWPTNEISVRGMVVDRVVYVAGWEESEAQGIEVADAVMARSTPAEVVIEDWPGTMQVPAFKHAAEQSARLLADQRSRGAVPASPFIDPGTITAAPRYRRGAPPRTRRQRLLSWLGFDRG